MLIGISGKIGSGKDTVAKIIQFLIFKDQLKKQGKELIGSSNVHWKVFSNWGDAERAMYSNYSIQKYAGALKDIVCRLIGCTREQLEDPVFKETELGEEWDCWFMADVKYPKLFPPDAHMEWIAKGEKYFKRKMTPRILLQLMGTECGRNILHPNIWINALYAEYKGEIGMITKTMKGIPTPDGKWSTGKHPNVPEEYWDKIIPLDTFQWTEKHDVAVHPNWIITDVRFQNELNALVERGGIPIRVSRNTGIHTPKPEDLHPSETALDDAPFKYYIRNHGTIEELIQQVEEILILENTIEDGRAKISN